MDLREVLAELQKGLSFYRQERDDGGLRTGIALGMTALFERFEIEGEEWDPSLAWSIELRCTGPSLPSVAGEVRSWLLARAGLIEEGFRCFSARLEAGSDPTGAFPLQFDDFAGLPPGESMKIVCTALRRVDAIFLASRLSDVGSRWIEYVTNLESTFHHSH